MSGLKQQTQLIEAKLEKLFSSFPNLPKEIVQVLNQYLYYLALAGIVFTILNLLGFNSSLFSQTVFLSWINGLIFFLSQALILYFLIKSLPGIRKKQLKGWRFLFYAALVGVIASVLRGLLTLVPATVFINFTFSMFALYILFQLKQFYK